MTDLIILKGKTFSRVLRWESSPFIYKAITGITKASPAVITVPGHGVPAGWRVAVVSAQGMRQINAKHFPLRGSDFTKATVLDGDTISLNDVNSADFSTYTSGGSVVYYTPVSLAAASARMQIRATAESEDPSLVSLVSPTDIVLDDTAKTITITISATATAAYTWISGVYDLELVIGSVVTRLLAGAISTVDEVTR